MVVWIEEDRGGVKESVGAITIIMEITQRETE